MEDETISSELRVETPQITKPRLYFIDNIRVFLTILVLLHHIAITYGGDGEWPILVSPSDAFTVVTLTVFTAVNQAFFMAFFFFISAYFLPRSLEKKGTAKFLLDRFIRLGIPLIVYLIFLNPLGEYILSNMYYNTNIGYFAIIQQNFASFSFSFGVLWFILALLIFNLVYVIIVQVTKMMKWNISLVKNSNSFPKTRTLFIGILVISSLTYLVRLLYPVGERLFIFQIGHFIQYISFFIFGLMAYRGNWFNNLTKKHGKLWGLVLLFTIPIAPLVLILEGALEYGVDAFLGGFTWQSVVYALWESLICFSAIIFFSYIFQLKFNKPNKFAQGVAKNAYTVYIIQEPVIYIFTLLFLNVSMHSMLKFLIVSPIVIVVAFITSFLIRQIPFAKRALG